MAVFNPVGPAAPSNVAVSAKSTLSITSSTLSATPGTETAIVIPAGTKAFSIRAKSNSGIAAKLLIATASGSTATEDRFDLMPGNTWKEDLLTGDSSITIYVASTKASTVVQLMYWS